MKIPQMNNEIEKGSQLKTTDYQSSSRLSVNYCAKSKSTKLLELLHKENVASVNVKRQHDWSREIVGTDMIHTNES
jgi:hypothetical protein